MAKFKNKYRIESTRLQNWDYGSNGAYFVTICTKNRFHFFGKIKGGKMKHSPIGHIANSCWHEIPNHFPFVELGAHIIMPDHVHGIVIINKPIEDHKPRKNEFGPQSRNLASIIRGFKTGVTVNARKINPDFEWQALYWDHIIRNDHAFQNITKYIKNNPQQWEKIK